MASAALSARLDKLETEIKTHGGRRKGSGRKAGTPNKTTSTLKEMILAALAKSGGVDYLITQAEDEPKAFMALLGRVLPMQVAGDEDGGPLQIVIKRFTDAVD